MAGGNTSSSSGSGRAHFRSQSGCCICGTKSSSSRFILSERYSEHFRDCFGSTAATRSGDLCNACVLCVKRWFQRDRAPGLFSAVLDSKKGAGPKHMKEITKRARRREARQSNVNTKKPSVKPEPGPVSSALLMNVTTGTTRHAAAISGVVSPVPFNSINASLISTGPSLGTRSACIGSAATGGISSALGSSSGGGNSFVHRSGGHSSSSAYVDHGYSHSATPSTRSLSSNASACASDEPITRGDRRFNSSTTCAPCCWRTKLYSPRTRQSHGSTGATVAGAGDHDDNGGMDNDSGLSLGSTPSTCESTYLRTNWTAPTEGATLTRAAARKSEAVAVRALSYSTPARGVTHSSRESVYTKCTPSETSEYGSYSMLSSSEWSNASGLSQPSTSSMVGGPNLGPCVHCCHCCGCCCSRCCCCCCHFCCCVHSCCSGERGGRRSANNTSQCPIEERKFNLGLSAADYHPCLSEPCKRAKYDAGMDKRRATGGASLNSPPAHCTCCHCPCVHHHGCQLSGRSSCSTPNSATATPPSSAANSVAAGLSLTEFRYPPPPSTNNVAASGPLTRQADANQKNNPESVTAGDVIPVANNTTNNAAVAAAPSQVQTDNAAINDSQNTNGTNSMPSTRRYNRRVVLPPVRMTQNAEVNVLLREIMERNSQAINFDSREMHMAVQQRLRSRNAHPNSTSGSISGRASSISSADGSVDAGGSQVLSGSRTPDGVGCCGGAGITVDEDELMRCSTHGIRCSGTHSACHHCHHHHHHHHCQHKQGPCSAGCALLSRSSSGETRSTESKRN